MIDSIKADRKKYVSDRVDYFTSAKGQAEVHEKKEQFCQGLLNPVSAMYLIVFLP
ncbi:hypothetical protein AGMMS49990_05640 [Endomicrobiia bacterium]|nr:hypothetical protein AGMMS49990_05640 [Endomicrobiia bacterium]